MENIVLEFFSYVFLFLAQFALALLFWGFLLSRIKVPMLSDPPAHWHKSYKNLSCSTMKFYGLLREKLEEENIPTITGMKTVAMAESHIFSARRKYFRVNSKYFSIDVCGAPFGKDYFFSTWLINRISLWRWLVKRIPYFGEFFDRQFWPMKYHRVDSMQSYMDAVNGAVMDVVDAIVIEKGQVAMTAEERKPIVRDIFLRK